MKALIHLIAAHYYTLCTILIGTTILGITTGALGTFALLRKQSLLGDAISHAALPGIALMFLCTHSKNPILLLCGGALTGSVGIALMILVNSKTKLKSDAILGIVLSVFFGLGLVLLSVIQKLPVAEQSILNKFLFGNASTLLPEDLWMISILSAITLLCLALFWKQFKILTFDAHFAHTCGYHVEFLTVFLTALILIGILIGLQTVGVILTSTLLIAPAAAARQWTKSLGGMTLCASLFGAAINITGTLLSSAYPHLPTGPTIVLVASIVVLFSFLETPKT